MKGMLHYEKKIHFISGNGNQICLFSTVIWVIMDPRNQTIISENNVNMV